MPEPGKAMPSIGYSCINEDVSFYMREGDTVPENGACPAGGKTVELRIKDLVSKKRILIVTVPGAFTPTCSNNQVPSFDKYYNELKEAGELDEIYVMAVNDSFVMNAWFNDMGIENVKALPDGNCSFTMRLNYDTGLDQIGLGRRCRRGAFLFQNGQLVDRWVEDFATEENPDPYHMSHPILVGRDLGIAPDVLATWDGADIFEGAEEEASEED